MTLSAMACCAPPRGHLDFVVVGSAPRDDARDGRAESDLT